VRKRLVAIIFECMFYSKTIKKLALVYRDGVGPSPQKGEEWGGGVAHRLGPL